MTLLFVEDDGDDVELTMLGFRSEGFEHEIVVARDGQAALDLLRSDYAAARPLPGAIMTDLKMTRMDGLEMLHRLKEDPRLRNIPVVFLTSSGDENDRSEAMRLGAGHYLRKPSNLDSYAGIVDRIREVMGTTAPDGRRSG
ncbi:MAG: response regulator [Elusimicrobiota bacterium]|nr:MAG: response regulator [Elusimicrobiota bacterium]